MRATHPRDAAPVALTPHRVRAGRALCAVSLAAIALATLMPAPLAPVTEPLCLICGERGGVDAILNFLLFLPLGAGLFLDGQPARRALALTFLISACIEITQGVAIPGRHASVGDLLFNSVGGAAGFALVACAPAMLQPSPRAAARLTAAWSVLWLAVQLVVSYALSPSLPDSSYYLQVGRSLPGIERFPGTVLGVRLAGRPLQEGVLPNSAQVRADLLAATPLVVTASAAGATPRTAPIVRVSDSGGRGMLLLAQRGTSLLLTTRTGADRLRLRPPMIEMPLALATADGALESRVFTVASRRSRDAMSLTLSHDGRVNEVRVPLSLSLGWTLILPAQWRLHSGMTERLLSLIWIAVPLLPLGWWSARASFGWRALAVATVIIGLAVLPRAFGLPAAITLEWGAALLGVAFASAASLARNRPREVAPADPDPVELQPHSAAASRQESATA